MIYLDTSKFLSPTKKFRRLSVLLAIHNAPQASQSKIAHATRLSSSMVNNYIKELKRDDLLIIAGNTNRTQSYHLTASGYRLLTDSLLAYSSEIVQIYGAVKREIGNLLNGFHKEGLKTIALFGAAETAEVVYAAVKDTPLVIVGIVDNDISKIGRPFNGFFIQPPEKLREINPDAVLITSYAKQEEIYKSIRNIIGDDIRIKNLSDLRSI